MYSVCIGGSLTDGESIEIALQDLTVESTGISKMRTLLADVQVRSLHSEAILKDSGTRNSLGYTVKGRSARANRVIDSVGQL